MTNMMLPTFFLNVFELGSPEVDCLKVTEWEIAWLILYSAADSTTMSDRANVVHSSLVSSLSFLTLPAASSSSAVASVVG